MSAFWLSPTSYASLPAFGCSGNCVARPNMAISEAATDHVGDYPTQPWLSDIQEPRSGSSVLASCPARWGKWRQ